MMMDERPMIDVCCVREQKVVSSYNGVSVLLARFRFDGALQRQFDVDDATSRSVAVSDSQTRHNAYRNQFPAIPPPPTNTNSFPIRHRDGTVGAQRLAAGAGAWHVRFRMDHHHHIVLLPQSINRCDHRFVLFCNQCNS
jgi:hypothetical protein